MPELSNLSNIETCLLVRIELPNEVIQFTDYYRELNVNGEVAAGLGQFVSISNTASELRATIDPLTVTMTGIPNANISKVLNTQLKGNKILVARVLIDPVTGDFLNVPTNYILRFVGYIENYEIQEDYDVDSRTSTNTINIVCNSLIEMLNNKYTGRRTNPTDQKKFFPNDASMDRVPSLVNTEFNFGGTGV